MAYISICSQTRALQRHIHASNLLLVSDIGILTFGWYCIKSIG